jgi:tetratricopeptide (TPR) repeat protein
MAPVPVVHSGEPTSAAAGERETVAGLEALARDPKAQVLFPTGCVEVAARHADEFEAALKNCRGALRDNVANADLRANLGALLFMRDTVRGADFGGVEKSLDHFLAALAADPRHRATLTYLGRDAFLEAYRARLTARDLDALEQVLQRAILPDNYHAYRVFLRLLVADPDRLSEVMMHAHHLTVLDPNSPEAWVAWGAAQLGLEMGEEAFKAFKKALTLDPPLPEKAVALLGVAACQFTQDDMDASEQALTEAKALPLRPEDLDAAAREYGVDAPGEIGRWLGESFAAMGLRGRALPWLGIERLRELIADEALDLNYQGVQYYDQNDFANAYEMFRQAVELTPDKPAYLENLAWCSHKCGRYRQAIWAYGKLAELQKLSADEYSVLGRAHAILGDYAGARTVLDEAVQAFPDDDPLRQWRTVIAYLAGGWDEAEKAWRESHPGLDSSQDRFDRFNLIYAGVRDIANWAQNTGGRYLTFGQLSKLHYLLGELEQHATPDEEGKRWVGEQRKSIRSKLVGLYQDLPLKPAASAQARRLAAEAEAFVDAGDLQKAVKSYRQAVEWAPCWPEGIYNLALTARAAGPWLPGAIEEMKIYLDLVPGDKDATAARSLLAQWEADLQRALEAGGEIRAQGYPDWATGLAELMNADNGGVIPSLGRVESMGKVRR